MTTKKSTDHDVESIDKNILDLKSGEKIGKVKEANLAPNTTLEKSKKSQFKPGDKPYYEFDGSVLNANVPWNELVQELNERGYSQVEIAQYAECSQNVIKDILNKEYDGLCFRAGARIITLHSNHCPPACN